SPCWPEWSCGCGVYWRPCRGGPHGSRAGKWRGEVAGGTRTCVVTSSCTTRGSRCIVRGHRMPAQFRKTRTQGTGRRRGGARRGGSGGGGGRRGGRIAIAAERTRGGHGLRGSRSGRSLLLALCGGGL